MQVRQQCCALSVTLVLLYLLSMAATLWAREAEISWQAPTVDEEGALLNDLKGFRIHYGRISRGGKDSLAQFQYESTTGLIFVGTTSFPVTGLREGVKYYFSVTAIDHSDNQSR